MPHTDIGFELGKKIGGNIKRLRKGAGMSQKHLAQGVEISQQALSYYESGRRNKFEGLVLLMRICRELGVGLNELVK